MLRRAINFFRRDKETTVMLLFFIFLFHMSRIPAPEPTQGHIDTLSETKRIQTAQKMNQVSRDRLLQVTPETLPLHTTLLGLLAIFFMGILINIVSLVYYRHHPFLPDEPFPGRPVPWGMGDIFKMIVVLFFFDTVIGLGIQFFFHFTHTSVANRNAFIMGTAFYRNIAITLYILWWALVRDKLNLASIGLETNGWIRDILTGMVFYICLFPIYFAVGVIITFLVQMVQYEVPVQAAVQIVYKEQSAQLVIMFTLFIAFLGPIFEEIIFRGFLYRAFRNRFGLWTALIGSSLLFATLHGHMVAFVPIFVLGFALALVYEKTRSILPCMVLHMCHNMIALSMMFQMKALS